ncbi:contact-dependent growth inhibition system immunity protein [Streptomyces sp. Ag109_G2-15]|uniref:contact-dependent growth inhibition system immunity protein n=1 Tax=Streptomyces sp. Ag109_G2-15 TaxID=1938850 RepID=UPI00211C96A3|nr:contact-dependent growth inhibition system immunity protein [Streptomyces sp. Ag109_G2-15]
MLSDFVDKDRSIEELEGRRWPAPPEDGTPLVRGVHELRRRAVKDLSVEDMRRLIGQDVGLQWLLPVALDFLRETAPQEAATGWYDDDLLSAVLTRKTTVWRDAPQLARHLDETVGMLTDISPYIRREVEDFRAALSDVL